MNYLFKIYINNDFFYFYEYKKNLYLILRYIKSKKLLRLTFFNDSTKRILYRSENLITNDSLLILNKTSFFIIDGCNILNKKHNNNFTLPSSLFTSTLFQAYIYESYNLQSIEKLSIKEKNLQFVKKYYNFLQENNFENIIISKSNIDEDCSSGIHDHLNKLSLFNYKKLSNITDYFHYNYILFLYGKHKYPYLPYFGRYFTFLISLAVLIYNHIYEPFLILGMMLYFSAISIKILYFKHQITMTNPVNSMQLLIIPFIEILIPFVFIYSITNSIFFCLLIIIIFCFFSLMQNLFKNYRENLIDIRFYTKNYVNILLVCILLFINLITVQNYINLMGIILFTLIALFFYKKIFIYLYLKDKT